MPKISPRPFFLTASQRPPPESNPHLGYEFPAGPPHPYFKGRGLRNETIRHFGLGCACKAASLKGRVPIPLHSPHGVLTGYAARWPDESIPGNRPRYRFIGGGEDEPFNLHRVLKARSPLPVLITTAPFDVFHLWQCGYEPVIGLFAQSIHERVLGRILEHVPNHRFLLLFDETDQGRTIRWDLLNRLGRYAWVRALEFAEDGRKVESLTPQEVKDI